MDKRSAHSPLGASGASRWMVCSGSVGLAKDIIDDEDDTFSGPGKAAHALAAQCLTHNMDGWEWMGYLVAPTGELLNPRTKPSDARLLGGGDPIIVGKEMADAVQMYLDDVRQWHPNRNQGNTWIEHKFYCSNIHEHFYGQSDLVYVDENILHVWDFKYGAGIVVEVPWNAQCMYYACGIIEDLQLGDEVDRVMLHIHQPRGFHFDGVHRVWSISIDDLLVWLHSVLKPAMDRALVSRETKSGEHCRFCPVRGLKCPQIMADMDELEILMQAKKLTAQETGRLLDLMVPAMIGRKQWLKNATGMLNAGKKVPGWKLAAARSNRQFKDGANAAAVDKFGDAALTLRELKSPAQIDALPEGDAFTTRWAFKPDAGTTVVPARDSRREVSRDTKSMFKARTKGKKK